MTTITVDRVALDKAMSDKLTKAAERMEAWHMQRDQLIYEAWQQGAGYREIARAVGLTHPAVMNIVTRVALEQKELTMQPHQEIHPLSDPGGWRLMQSCHLTTTSVGESVNNVPDDHS